jgi:hypothetical protein
MIYHLAIWQYLALDQGAEFGLPAGGYALAILIRVAGISWFSLQISLRNPQISRINFSLTPPAATLSPTPASEIP